MPAEPAMTRSEKLGMENAREEARIKTRRIEQESRSRILGDVEERMARIARDDMALEAKNEREQREMETRMDREEMMMELENQRRADEAEARMDLLRAQERHAVRKTELMEERSKLRLKHLKEEHKQRRTMQHERQFDVKIEDFSSSDSDSSDSHGTPEPSPRMPIWR